MVSREQARRLALSLPHSVEQDHHGRPSFRVAGRIFSTLWDEERMNVMVDPDGVRTVTQAHPDACEECWWGKRLAAVTVILARVEQDFLLDLLSDAWERKAPARLLRERGDSATARTRHAARGT
jgi:hypothetical protein